MTNSPSGGWTTHDVNEWVMGQAQFLSPTQTLVLWYLAANAWLSDASGGTPGEVMTARVSLSKIQLRTSLGQRTIRYALDDLQDMGYIWCEHKPGNGKSRIIVFWDEGADETRAGIRAGIRDLPKALQRTQPEAKKSAPKTTEEATILPFRRGK